MKTTGEKSMTAVTDGNARCADCRWFTGTSHKKAECVNPDKQKQFANLDKMRLSLGGTPANARYKYPSYPACKRFEEKQ